MYKKLSLHIHKQTQIYTYKSLPLLTLPQPLSITTITKFRYKMLHQTRPHLLLFTANEEQDLRAGGVGGGGCSTLQVVVIVAR